MKWQVIKQPPFYIIALIKICCSSKIWAAACLASKQEQLQKFAPNAEYNLIT